MKLQIAQHTMGIVSESLNQIMEENVQANTRVLGITNTNIYIFYFRIQFDGSLHMNFCNVKSALKSDCKNVIFGITVLARCRAHLCVEIFVDNYRYGSNFKIQQPTIKHHLIEMFAQLCFLLR